MKQKNKNNKQKLMKKLILVFLALLFIPLITGASFNTNLYYGLQNNSDVRELQELLIDKGFLTGTPATGNFFSLTLKAVKAYQASEGIIQTGYVGILTRTAINNDLAMQLSASNAESTTETGTTPPISTPPATTNDVVATLQAQIALLLQQVQAMQSQQATTQQLQQTTQQQAQIIQQIQQNTQQIAQNTTPPPTPVCNPNWQCGNWNTCANSQQTRICNDSNNCGTSNNKPSEIQSCVIRGCTDKNMQNYNPNAKENDGSCVAWPELSISCSGIVKNIIGTNYYLTFTANATGGDGNYQYYWGGAITDPHAGTRFDPLEKQCSTRIPSVQKSQYIYGPANEFNVSDGYISDGCFNNYNILDGYNIYVSYPLTPNTNSEGEYNGMANIEQVYIRSAGKIKRVDCPIPIPAQ